MKVNGTTGPNRTDMLYAERLAGPHGSSFFLFKEKFHTKEDIKRAKAFLKRNQDVVSIHIIDSKEATK